MNPSQTPARTATLPMRLASAKPVATTSGAVRSPTTTSSRRITWAGEKKCSPSTSCGRRVTAAISFTSR